jgi:hypothetical protein
LGPSLHSTWATLGNIRPCYNILLNRGDKDKNNNKTKEPRQGQQQDKRTKIKRRRKDKRHRPKMKYGIRRRSEKDAIRSVRTDKTPDTTSQRQRRAKTRRKTIQGKTAEDEKKNKTRRPDRPSLVETYADGHW